MPVEPGPIRRVVTGTDEQGRSKVVWDGPALSANPPMGGGRSYADLWIWNETPPPLAEAEDAAERGYDFPGPPAGGHLRIVQGRGRPGDYDPAKDAERQPYHAPEAEAAGLWSRGGRAAFSSHMHKTKTIDYAVLMAGGRELALDDRTVTLAPGDFVIDLGAWHQWHTPPAGSIMAFDMIAAAFPDGPKGLIQGKNKVVRTETPLALPEGVRPARRVVIGDLEDGKSSVISDGASPDVKTDPARPGYAATRLWVIDRAPAPLVQETLHLPDALEPPKQGSVFRVVTVPPDDAWKGRAGSAEVAAWFRAAGSPGASAYSASAPHPYMQKTATLDFCLLLDGEAVLVLDTEEVPMKAGEVAVVRGARHAWANRSTAPAVIAIASHDAR